MIKIQRVCCVVIVLLLSAHGLWAAQGARRPAPNPPARQTVQQPIQAQNQQPMHRATRTAVDDGVLRGPNHRAAMPLQVSSTNLKQVYAIATKVMFDRNKNESLESLSRNKEKFLSGRRFALRSFMVGSAIALATLGAYIKKSNLGYFLLAPVFASLGCWLGSFIFGMKARDAHREYEKNRDDAGYNQAVVMVCDVNTEIQTERKEQESDRELIQRMRSVYFNKSLQESSNDLGSLEFKNKGLCLDVLQLAIFCEGIADKDAIISSKLSQIKPQLALPASN